jgi:hypothetical protein
MKFRKKPVVIEAIQVPNPNDPLSWGMLAGFLGSCKDKWSVSPGGSGLDVETLEGIMHANIGDWIIKGVKGEFYPCKPDIFDATYEAVK